MTFLGAFLDSRCWIREDGVGLSEKSSGRRYLSHTALSSPLLRLLSKAKNVSSEDCSGIDCDRFESSGAGF